MSSPIDQAIERTRLVFDLPPYTAEKFERLRAMTGMTRIQLMIMLVERGYDGLMEELQERERPSRLQEAV